MEKAKNELFQVTGLPGRKEKRVELGERVFLAGKDFIGERKEVLCCIEPVDPDFAHGEKLYLDYQALFVIRGRLLQVEAKRWLAYGPLGERHKLTAYYDGERIGNYSSIRSYAGGGHHGDWPAISNKDWHLVFSFAGSNGRSDIFRIEYFESLFPELPRIFDPTPPSTAKLISDPADPRLASRLTIEDLVPHRKVYWELPVTVPGTEAEQGKLSCCYYTGYEQLRFAPCAKYGSEELRKIEEPVFEVGIVNIGRGCWSGRTQAVMS